MAKVKIMDYLSANNEYGLFYYSGPKVRKAYHNYVRWCVNSGKKDKIKPMRYWLATYQQSELKPLKEISAETKIPLQTVDRCIKSGLKHFLEIVKANPQKYDLLFPLIKTNTKE